MRPQQYVNTLVTAEQGTNDFSLRCCKEWLTWVNFFVPTSPEQKMSLGSFWGNSPSILQLMFVKYAIKFTWIAQLKHSNKNGQDNIWKVLSRSLLRSTKIELIRWPIGFPNHHRQQFFLDQDDPWLHFQIVILSYLPTHSRFFFPGTVAASFLYPKFRSMHSGGRPFDSSQGHLNLITWYLILEKKSMMLDWFTYMTCFPVDFSVPSKKTKLRDYRWTMCYHL